jgi:hypothetical protein
MNQREPLTCLNHYDCLLSTEAPFSGLLGGDGLSMLKPGLAHPGPFWLRVDRPADLSTCMSLTG